MAVEKVTMKSSSYHSIPSHHPSTAQMFNASITALNVRGGSSLQAIKKYMAGAYMADVQRLAPYIKRHLKKSLEDGSIIQTKGIGASGYFKLAGKTAAKKTETKPSTSKAKISPVKKVKTTVEKTVKESEKSSTKTTAGKKKAATASKQVSPVKSPEKPPTKKKVTPAKSVKIADKTAKTVKSPKAVKTAKVAKSPKAVKTAKVAKSPKAVKTAKVEKSPKTNKTAKTTKKSTKK